MRTYITPIGYNSTSVTRPVILSQGVREGDQVVLIRPAGEMDERATEAIDDIKGLLYEIEPDVTLAVEEVPQSFENSVLACRDIIDAAEGERAVSLGGGARDILLPFTIAVLTRLNCIEEVLFFSDLDGSVKEWTLPYLDATISDPAKTTLGAIVGTGETTLPELTNELSASKSTVTRHVEELVSSGAVETWRDGKIKHVRPTLTGCLLAG